MTEALTSLIESETGRLAQISDAVERFHAAREYREALAAGDRKCRELEQAAAGARRHCRGDISATSRYRECMTHPNSTLRAVRISMMLSQDDFATALRDAGARAGLPIDASKRLVQRWESGAIAVPSPRYARALEAVTGMPIDTLGFSSPVMARVAEDGAGGHDVHPST
jgi:DNA-binding transcriptional regulator YiaG